VQLHKSAGHKTDPIPAAVSKRAGFARRAGAGGLMATSALVALLFAACATTQPVESPAARQPTGSLHDPRFATSATLLKTGKVLVAGGVAAEGSASSVAELYDPANGGFLMTGSMISGRSYHTATLLGDGKVLFVGGIGKDGRPVRAAELYDPATGEFEPTGNMIDPRFNHTATLLQNGKVLIAGGEVMTNNDKVIDTAELYDPAAGTFSQTGNVTRFFDPSTDKIFYEGMMGGARTKHTATLLQNGEVLIAGGGDANGKSLASAQIYNPANGKFTPSSAMNYPRKEHRATLIREGQVLMTGGLDGNDNILASAELYNPSTGKFVLTTAAFPGSGSGMIYARYEHTATLLANGQVLIAGGGGERSILGTAELYDPSRGAFGCVGGRMARSESKCNKSMSDYRNYPSAVLLTDGTVFIAGGYNFRTAAARNLLAAQGILNSPNTPFSLIDSAEIYNPAAGAFISTLAIFQASSAIAAESK
jgi:hypothetical protein